MSYGQCKPEWRAKEGPEPVQEIFEAVRENARDGRLDCEEALSLARKFGVSPEQIGKACDRLKIRISRCQLGCFK